MGVGGGAERFGVAKFLNLKAEALKNKEPESKQLFIFQSRGFEKGGELPAPAETHFQCLNKVLDFWLVIFWRFIFGLGVGIFSIFGWQLRSAVLFDRFDEPCERS